MKSKDKGYRVGVARALEPTTGSVCVYVWVIVLNTPRRRDWSEDWNASYRYVYILEDDGNIEKVILVAQRDCLSMQEEGLTASTIEAVEKDVERRCRVVALRTLRETYEKKLTNHRKQIRSLKLQLKN